MILNYNSFIYEKLGINDDVIILSDFLFDYLKNIKFEQNKSITIDDIPNVSFKIKEIIIKFINYNNNIASFDISKSKYSKDGYKLYINLSNNYTKNELYHELSNVIQHDKLTTKKIEYSLGNYNSVNNSIFKDKFNNLINMLYYSDDSEISSFVHQVYSEMEIYFKKYNKNNSIFEYFLSNNNHYNISKYMINYDIFEDLKNIDEKEQILFFKYLYNLNNIKIKNNKFINKIYIAYKTLCIIFGKNDDSNLDDIKLKTQKFINNQGEKLNNKLIKLYGLIF